MSSLEQIHSMIARLPAQQKAQLVNDIFQGKEVTATFRRGMEVYAVQLVNKAFRVVTSTVSEHKGDMVTMKVTTAPEGFERKTLCLSENEVFVTKEMLEEALFAALEDIGPQNPPQDNKRAVPAKTVSVAPPTPQKKTAAVVEEKKKEKVKMDLYPKGDQFIQYMDFLAQYEITPGDYENGTPASELVARFIKQGVGTSAHWRVMVALLRQKFKVEALAVQFPGEDKRGKMMYPMRLRGQTPRQALQHLQDHDIPEPQHEHESAVGPQHEPERHHDRPVSVVRRPANGVGVVHPVSNPQRNLFGETR